MHLTIARLLSLQPTLPARLISLQPTLPARLISLQPTLPARLISLQPTLPQLGARSLRRAATHDAARHSPLHGRHCHVDHVPEAPARARVWWIRLRPRETAHRASGRWGEKSSRHRRYAQCATHPPPTCRVYLPPPTTSRLLAVAMVATPSETRGMVRGPAHVTTAVAVAQVVPAANRCTVRGARGTHGR